MEAVTSNADEAFLALVNQYQGAIRRVCRTYAATSEDREEIFQEIIYQLWRSFPSYRGESAAMTWVYRVALNTAITALRKQVARPRHVSLEPSHEPEVIGPPIDAHATSRSEWLYRAVRQLNAVDRALVMCYLDGLSYKGIAEVLGLSDANVATRLHRIKGRLQELAKRVE